MKGTDTKSLQLPPCSDQTGWMTSEYIVEGLMPRSSSSYLMPATAIEQELHTRKASVYSAELGLICFLVTLSLLSSIICKFSPQFLLNSFFLSLNAEVQAARYL